MRQLIIKLGARLARELGLKKKKKKEKKIKEKRDACIYAITASRDHRFVTLSRERWPKKYILAAPLSTRVYFHRVALSNRVSKLAHTPYKYPRYFLMRQ